MRFLSLNVNVWGLSIKARLFQLENEMHNNVKQKLSSILSPIAPYMAKVDEQIREKIKTGVSLIDEGSLHLLQKGGKKIRAALIILTSGLKGAIPDDVVEVAAAAEIVHAATLVHDDIIDGSTYRRGDLTVAKKFGNRVAVLVGDYMYTRALEVAVGDDRLDLFPIMVSATRDMVKGELYQIEYSNINKITKEHYRRIIEMKTARFMAACAKLGGVKSKMSDQESDLLYEFGLNLGFAFQIVDDALDFIEAEEVTGKDAGNDFMQGKITLPMLHLIENISEKEKREIEELMNNPTPASFELIRGKVRESGGIDYCIAESEQYVRKAIKYLDIFGPTLYKDILIALSEFFLERNY